MAIRIETEQRLNGYIESLIGGRSENQDAAGFRDVPLGSIVVVCDGMGGGNGGSTASHLAVQTVIDDVTQAPADSDPVTILRESIAHANEVIRSEAKTDAALEGMGTTLVAILITAQSAIVAHVGDSRLYQLRGRQKVFRTWDHSMVFQMVASGLITEEDARNHPQSNVILAGLGIYDTVEPTVAEISYNKGDRFVLCTDGFWGAMPEKDFIKLISRRGNLQETLENAAREINSIGVRKGGKHDNLTAAVFNVQCNSKLKPKMRNSLKIILVALVALLLVSGTFNVLMYRFMQNKDVPFKLSELVVTNSEDEQSADETASDPSSDQLNENSGQ